MSLLVLPMFLLLVALAGITLDLYIEETYREDLQDALDRGVLAAAAPHQKLDRKEVVWSYINSRTFADKRAEAQIAVEEEAAYTRVSARAAFDMDAIVLSVISGKPPVILAAAEAFQSEEPIEISLVVDISSSMVRDVAAGTAQRRLEVLKAAAKRFTTLLLRRADAARISISLVPYSGQVNAGIFFDHFASTRRWPEPWAHSCFEFADEDFRSATMPSVGARLQVPQFQDFHFEKDDGHSVEWGWCPAPPVLALSNDRAALQARIDALVAHDGSGTNNGVKWGLGLLDPSMREVMLSLHNSGANRLPAEIRGRPSDYRDGRTRKYLVILTDGDIDHQNRPKPDFLGETGPFTAGYWGEGPRYTEGGQTHASAVNRLSRLPDKSILDLAAKRDADRALRGVQLLSLCTIAKENGIRVFTIGFDVTPASKARDQMLACASAPSDFFDVEGLDLFAAFEQIHQSIARLRLTR